jgi:cation transport ATPase
MRHGTRVGCDFAARQGYDLRLSDAKARNRTGEAIRALLGLAAKTAYRIRGGMEEEVTVDQIEKGDILRVRPGEKIPVDGVIVDGKSRVEAIERVEKVNCLLTDKTGTLTAGKPRVTHNNKEKNVTARRPSLPKMNGFLVARVAQDMTRSRACANLTP